VFRDLLIVAAVLLAMVAAVGGVVGGSVFRLWNEKTKHAAMSPVAASPSDAQSNPATQPAALVPADPDAQAAGAVDAAPQSNSIELWAKDATLHGNVELVEGPPVRQWKGRGGRNAVPQSPAHHLGGFNAYQDYAAWTMEVLKAGEYEISLNCACSQWQQSHFEIKIGSSEVRFASEGSRSEMLFRVAAVGRVTLPAGKTTLIFRAAPIEREQPRLNLREVELIPTFSD